MSSSTNEQNTVGFRETGTMAVPRNVGHDNPGFYLCMTAFTDRSDRSLKQHVGNILPTVALLEVPFHRSGKEAAVCQGS